MKKLFSSKSGFSLIEIVVAFAIFAIMAAMVSSIMGLALNQRSANMKFADEVEAQKDMYAKIEKNLTYGTKSGELEIYVPGKTDPVKLAYSDKNVIDGSTNDKEGINYFVGDADYTKKSSTPAPGGDDDSPGVTNSLIDLVDSYIYGSPDFEYVKVVDFHKASEAERNKAKDDGILLTEEITKDDGTTEKKELAMYILDIRPKDSDAALLNRDLIVWRSVYVRLPYEVKECGYVLNSGGGKYAKTVLSSKIGESTGNNYEIVKSSTNTVNISIPKSKVYDYYGGKFDDKTNDQLYHFTGYSSGITAGSNKYYIIVNTTNSAATDVTNEWFGVNNTEKEGSAVLYKPYPKKDDKGNIMKDEFDKVLTHVNVYAAKDK